MQVNFLKQLIEAEVPGAQVILKGDDGVHFEATIISDTFEGKSLIQRQRIINQGLKTYFEDGSLHALSLKTLTNLEWEKKCSN